MGLKVARLEFCSLFYFPAFFSVDDQIVLSCVVVAIWNLGALACDVFDLPVSLCVVLHLGASDRCFV